MKFQIIATIFLLQIIEPLYAEDTLRISKEEVLKSVIENNLQLKGTIADQEAAKYDYRQSNSLFLPSVTFSHTGFMTNSPLMAFGTKLNQELLKPSDFDTRLLNNPDDRGGFTTKLELMQPLINSDGMAKRKAAKLKMEISRLQSDRQIEFLQMEAVKTYMELQLSYKAIGIFEKALSTAQMNETLITNYTNEGLTKSTDMLAIQLRVNEVKNMVQMSKTNFRNTSDYLGYLMNTTKTNIVFVPSESLMTDSETIQQDMEVSLSRKDIAAMDGASQIYKQMVNSTRLSFLPRLNMFASYERNGLDFINNDANGYMIGAQLSWNLFDGYKSIAVNQKSKVELDKSIIERNNYINLQKIELSKAIRQLDDASNHIKACQLAVEKATESYRIYKNRFNEGLEKTTDLLNAETTLQTAELTLAEAMFKYNYLKTYIKFLTAK